MSARISVVVPLYNKRNYILRCLESVRRQMFADFEVIVVDDGSTDDSARVAQRIEDPRFRIVRQGNGGPGAARNRGILETSGELVAFLDGDDEWKPGFLEAAWGLALRYPEAGFFATGYRRSLGRDYDLEVTIASTGGSPVEISNYLELATEGDFVTASSVAARRTLLNEVGCFAENEPLGEDVDMWVRMGIRSRLAFDPAILAVYHSEAEGGSFERCRNSPPYPPVVRTLRRALEVGSVPASGKAAVEAYIDSRLLQYALRLLHLGDRRGFLNVLAGEPWKTPRFAREARLLRIGATLLPLRMVYALKWKPMNLVMEAKRLIQGELSWMGSRIIHRLVPVDLMEPLP